MSIILPGLQVNSTIKGNGISVLENVRVSTITNGTLATSYENLDTIDDITLATGDRILLKNQTTSTENGIYIVQVTGAPIRSDDFIVGDSVVSKMIPIDEGTVNADTMWLCTNDLGSDIVGTNNLSFQQISGQGVDGDVSGPGSSTTNIIPKFGDTTGTSLIESGMLIDGSNNVSGTANMTITGTLNLTRTNNLIFDVATIATSDRTITFPDPGGPDNIAYTSLTQTLTNKTLTSPIIGTSILDTNSNDLFIFTATASAVNELTYANAATGINPSFTSSGTDTNIGLDLITKGTGTINISSTSGTNSGILRLLDNTGGQYGALTVPDTTTTSYTLQLPDGVGTTGQVLTTDGNNPAVLTWSTPAGGGNVSGPGSSTDNAVVRWDGVSGTTIQNSGHNIGDNGDYTLSGTSAYIELPDITAPTNPGASLGRLYKKSSDDGLFWLPDAAGAEVDLTGAGSITNSIQSSATDTSTTSTTYVVINSMTVTPAAGTYLATFSSSGNLSVTNMTANYAMHNNGTIVSHSERDIRTGGGQTTGMYSALHSQVIVTVTGSEAIDVRFLTPGGTFTIRERSLILIKLA